MAVALLVLTLASCGGAEPPPAALDAETVRDNAIAALEELTSVRFEMTHEVGSTSLGGGLLLESAIGTAVLPDRAQTTAKARVSSLNVVVELGIVQIGSQAYMQDPFSSVWREVDPASLPFTFNGINVAVGNALAAVRELALLDDGAVSGAYILSGTVGSEALRALVPGAADGLTLGLEVTVRRDDFRVRRLRLSGPFLSGEPDDIVRIVEFSGFGDPITIDPPL